VASETPGRVARVGMGLATLVDSMVILVSYRKRGGRKRAPLPDFYIGAHSAVRGYRLLTRDAPRYRTYFPTVGLIAL
jgi:predicted nucleic acid-binding protein